MIKSLEALIHRIATAALANTPVVHSEHDPPSAPVYPALHLQSTASSLPAADCASALHKLQVVDPDEAEYVFAAHAEHDALPVTALYWPARHELHSVPSAPVKPGVKSVSRCSHHAAEIRKRMPKRSKQSGGRFT